MKKCSFLFVFYTAVWAGGKVDQEGYEFKRECLERLQIRKKMQLKSKGFGTNELIVCKLLNCFFLTHILKEKICLFTPKVKRSLTLAGLKIKLLPSLISVTNSTTGPMTHEDPEHQAKFKGVYMHLRGDTPKIATVSF